RRRDEEPAWNRGPHVRDAPRDRGGGTLHRHLADQDLVLRGVRGCRGNGARPPRGVRARLCGERARACLSADLNELATIAAEVGTPFYAYDLDRFRERIRAFEEALADVPHLTCYAAKANDALAVLRVVAAEGLGADVVSGGELVKCLSAGISPDGIVFSGVGKREDEIRAAVEAGIRSLNVESLEELDEIASAATSLGRVAPIAVRLNPDVAGGGHEYLSTGGAASKFGLGPAGGLAAPLLLEPRRHLVGPAGTFVTRVLHVKKAGGRTIVVCDGGTNDLLRPALYGAEHPVTVLAEGERERATVDLAGPLCESGDFLALDRTLPLPQRGDLIAVE